LDSLGLQLASRLTCFRDALLGQIDVTPAGEQVLQVPIALTMTNKYEKTVSHWLSSEIFQSQNVHHRVKPWLLALCPTGRVHRSTREDHSILGLVRQFKPFRRPREDHAVFANHAATAQGCEPDMARLTRARMALAALDRLLVELDATAIRGRS